MVGVAFPICMSVTNYVGICIDSVYLVP